MTGPDAGERSLGRIILAALAVKLLLAALIPLTGDEAYFVLWGEKLDYGYYDHPPMVGWMIWAALALGKNALIVRLPAVGSTLLVGWALYRGLEKYDREKAHALATLYLLSPLNLLYVLVTTDTPLIIFSALSALALLKAEEEGSYKWYALSGVALGGCFLSKYFAALLALAYLAHYLAGSRTGKRAAGLALLYACVIPFGLVNLHWNYTHGWANILFNLYNRHGGEKLGLGNLAGFLAVQAYLVTPVLLHHLWKKRRGIIPAARKDKNTRLMLLAFAVPQAALLALSLKKSIGLHWALSFYPMGYAVLFAVMEGRELRKAARAMAWWTGAHLALVAVALALPVTAYKGLKNYDFIVLGMKPQEVLAQLKPYQGEYAFATEGYTKSALMSFYGKEYFSVFASTSRYARQDDLNTDWSSLDGKNIAVLTSDARRAGEYAQYFGSYEVKEFTVEGAGYAVLAGKGFKYAVYKEKVLSYIKDKYYRVPGWLPVRCGPWERPICRNEIGCTPLSIVMGVQACIPQIQVASKNFPVFVLVG